ncbi:Kelch repeat-containing protein 1 [Wickerhamomyces ciferrii]|uniref:Kelch repeat-containing protein 1 n=1 Tax=Wickerhamomyces ciferrii (strain ATCC 14091 / BCRC 22168 / CBS 111 / JCM 3599 / NBRC 0793 / NRRL Y-1031 F-60-10) TaxID=1206466 RepID=K0KWR1_WICCF|nr:Kelch repeat-containing protein 1 [Wickerhamomyces ciferrii]CCH46472.1 Kelch repeat-containing protein 1 [Wickerhamomyces ciferrii]
MTPFKFGKKNKAKDKRSSKEQQAGLNDSAFSSPVSNKGEDSPTFSNYSNHSNIRNNNDQGNQGNQGNQFNSPQQFNNSPAQQNPQFKDQGVGIVYDQNNNYHTKSPQKFNQFGQPPTNPNTPRSLPFNQSPQQGQGLQGGQQGQFKNQPHPQYGQPLPPNAIQQQQQGGPQGQGQPPQRATFKSPWTRSKLLISPFPRYRHTASNYSNEKGEIFIMGGLHNTSVYGDTWILKPDSLDGEPKNFQSFQIDIFDNSPAPRVGHASTLCGNAYVIFGGDTVTNEFGEIDNDLYLFNMNSHAWTIPSPVGKRPSGRYGHSIGVIAITNFDSKVYLYGGQLDDVIFNDLCVFNLSSFRRPDVHWEWINPKDNIRPPPLTNHSMDVYDNKLWIFGGSNGKKLNNEIWCFDPELERWDQIKTLGQLPKPVEEHASVIYKDLLIIYGGKDSQGEAVSDLFFLNLITKTWFKFPTNFPLEPQGKYGHTLSILKNDKLLILGGHLPDYSNLGDNLEVSNIDNGVGTILNLLDLSNLVKLVPGLQQYSTPNKIQDSRFPNQHQGHQGQQQGNLFTPQKTPQGQIDSPIQSKSPQQLPQGQGQSQGQGNPQQVQTRGFSNSSGNYGQGGQGPNSANSNGPSRSIPNVGDGTGAAVGAGIGAVGSAVGYGSQNVSKNSLGSNQGPQGLSQGPGTQGPQDLSRQFSAEDVFQRERRNLTPKNLSQTPEKPLNNNLNVPSTGQVFSSPEEGELPLQIPSPIKTENEIPGSFPTNISSGQSGPESQEGKFYQDDFKTPQGSPSKTSLVPGEHGQTEELVEDDEVEDADEYLRPHIYKNDDAKQSDFLDSYVDGNSTSDLVEKGDDEEVGTVGTTGSGVGIGIAGATAGIAAVGGVAAVGNLGSSSSALKSPEVKDQLKSTSDVVLNPSDELGSRGIDVKNRDVNPSTSSGTGVTGTGIKGVSGNRDFSTASVSSFGNQDREEFKKIINSLSKELDSLKSSTNKQVKEASSKVKELELENDELKKKLNSGVGSTGVVGGGSTGTRELSTEGTKDLQDEDENSYKRKHIKLNTDYQILNQKHQQLQSKHEEIESIFESNLIDLSKLNNIIKKQGETLEETQKSLQDQEDWKLKYDELESKFEALNKRFDELSESRSKGFNETNQEVKNLNLGLDSFLSKYLKSNDGSESTEGTRGLKSSTGNIGDSDEVTTSLKNQIDELLKENEDIHTQHKSLTNKLSSFESNQEELESLRLKISELSKIEENYKDSLHSVKNSSRALQVSQNELNKQKELTTKLQQELDELKIFRANRKSSRNTTPIVNDFAKKDLPKGTTGTTTDEDEEDFENAHFNLKLRDLQAELFITKQERDELKQDVLDLKKKLLNSSTPTGSF